MANLLTNTRAVRVGSLFAGYGGLDLAIGRVFPAAEPVWFCEWDQAPSKVLAHHWPNVPNLHDVSAVDWSSVEPIEVLGGGFPCQDVSHAGRRSGLIRDGEGRTRSGLWGEMLKAIDVLRPKLVLAENVKGLLSAKADCDVEPCSWCLGDGSASTMRALGAVLADLADIGYDAAWYGVRAADVGAAHGRFRVFILGWPANGYPADLVEEWRVGSGGRGGRSEASTRGAGGDSGAQFGDVSLFPTPTGWQQGGDAENDDRNLLPLTVQRLSGSGRLLPTPDAYAADRGGSQHPDKRAAGGHTIALGDVAEHVLLPTPRATDGTKGGPNQRGSSGDLMLPSAVNPARLLPTPRASDPANESSHSSAGFRPQLGETARLLPTPVGTDSEASGRVTTTTGVMHSGTSLTDATVRQPSAWGEYGPAIDRWAEVIGRPAPPPTAPGPKGNPRLSPLFVEWLMGLPEGHVTDPEIGIGRNAQLKALGNGVVPLQGATALANLLKMVEVSL